MPRLSCLPLAAFAVALLLLATSPAEAKLTPAKRHYDSHRYYVVEIDPLQLPPGHSAADVATALGAEHVEQVGHLEDHYLIRAPLHLVTRGEESWSPKQGALQRREGGGELLREGATGVEERDLVMERYDLLRRRREGPASHLRARSITLPNGRLSSKSAIRSLERQHPRLRVKRDHPVLPPTLARRAVTLDARQATSSAAFGIIEQMANKFSIADPLWDKQWHLVNGVIQENSINVTGVWADGIYGSGVNVAIVDDGLDMHSDDLAPNFVSLGVGCARSRASS